MVMECMSIPIRRFGILSICILCLLTLATMVETGEAAEDWPTFRHGNDRTGVTSEKGPEDPNIRWIFETEGYVYSSPSYHDGRIYVGSNDSFAYCLDASTSKEIWKFETGGTIQGSITIAQGYAYVPSYDNSLYCLDAITGKFIWSFPTQGDIFSTPVVSADYVIFGSGDGNVYCVNWETGEEEWTFSAGGFVWGSPAVDGMRVFVGAGSNMYCLTLNTGFPVWATPLGEMIIASPAVYDGEVYIGTTGNNLPHYLYCLNADTGLINWQFANPDGGGFFSSAAVTESMVFVGSDSRKLYAVSRDSGDLRWEFETGGAISSSPAVNDRYVYFGSADGFIYCLDRPFGYRMWEVETPDVVYSSPCVVDGMLWVGCWDGNVYCIGPWARDLPGGQDFTYLKIWEPNGKNDTADANFTIKIIAIITHYNATISYYYSNQLNSTEATPIAVNLSIFEVRGIYDWDTSDIPGGKYFIKAVLVNGNTTLTDWSEEPVTIEHPKEESDDDFIPGPSVIMVIISLVVMGVFRRVLFKPRLE